MRYPTAVQRVFGVLDVDDVGRQTGTTADRADAEIDPEKPQPSHVRVRRKRVHQPSQQLPIVGQKSTVFKRALSQLTTPIVIKLD